MCDCVQGEADTVTDSDMKNHLLTAAKILADATARMVECAKACASHPDDIDHQMALKQAAENVRNATNMAASNALKKKLMKRLEVRFP